MALSWTFNDARTRVIFVWQSTDTISGQFNINFRQLTGTIGAVSYSTMPGRDFIQTVRNTVTRIVEPEKSYGGFLEGINRNGHKKQIGNYIFEVPAAPTPDPMPTAPAVPGSFAAGAITRTSIAVSWTKSTGATYYEVRRGTTGAWTRLGDVAVYTFSGLTQNTKYTLQLRAGNAVGASAITSIEATTAAPPPPVVRAPATPTNFKVTGSTATTLTVSWTQSARATRYDIRILPGDWTNIGDASEHTFKNLTANTTYQMRLRAANSGGTSAVVRATGATQRAAVPATPTGFRVVISQGGSITLAWNAVVGATRYETWVQGSRLTGRWVSQGTNLRITITGLIEGNIYTCRVRAVNAHGNSAYAELVQRAGAAPVDPGPDPGPTPGPAPPPVRLGEVSDSQVQLKHEITDKDGKKIDITERVVEFRVRYGAKVQDRETRPSRIETQGYFHVEDHGGTNFQYDDWRRLTIYAKGTKIYEAVTIQPELGEYGKVLFDLRLQASDLVRLEAPHRVSVGLADKSLAQYMVDSGLPIKRFANVDFPNMFVAGGSLYDGAIWSGGPREGFTIAESYRNNPNDFLDDVEAFGSLIMLEDPLLKEWNAYPLPPLADRRVARATVRASAVPILQDYEHLERQEWRHDSQVFTTLNPTTEVKTYTQLRAATRIRGEQPYAGRTGGGGRVWEWEWGLRGLPEGDAGRLLSYASVSGWSGFRRGGYGGSGNLAAADFGRTGIELRGGKIYLWFERFGVHTRDTVWVTLRTVQAVLLTDATPAPDEHQFFATGQSGNFEVLPRPKVSIPRMGTRRTTTEATINAALDRWESFQPGVLMMRMVVLAGQESLLQVEAGEIVNVRMAEVNHRCVVLGVELFGVDYKALELEWHVLQLSPLGQSAPSVRDVMFYGSQLYYDDFVLEFGAEADSWDLTLQGMIIGFSSEEVWFGRDTGYAN